MKLITNYLHCNACSNNSAKALHKSFMCASCRSMLVLVPRAWPQVEKMIYSFANKIAHQINWLHIFNRNKYLRFSRTFASVHNRHTNLCYTIIEYVHLDLHTLERHRHRLEWVRAEGNREINKPQPKCNRSTHGQQAKLSIKPSSEGNTAIITRKRY